MHVCPTSWADSAYLCKEPGSCSGVHFIKVHGTVDSGDTDETARESLHLQFP